MSHFGNFSQDRDKLLRELLQQAQSSNSLPKRQLVISRIAAIVMRSRPLCRQFNGTPLTGVYQEIYDLVKKQLLSQIEQKLIDYQKQDQTKRSLSKIKKLTPKDLYKMQTQTFQQILNHEQLKKLAISAQQYLPNSELRTYALTELIKGIKLSGKLCHPHVNKFPYYLYQSFYEEALTETMVYVCLNIDLYDPERGDKKFMNWVNFKLDKFMLKSYTQYNKYLEYNLPSFYDLEQISQPPQPFDLAEELGQYMRKDPEKKFQTTHIRNRSDANFQRITLAKIAGKNWEEISAELNIPVPTLSSFYNRWCRRFAPLLEAELNKQI